MNNITITRLNSLKNIFPLCSRLYCAAPQYEIKAERLAEIAKSPSGWVGRADPPPQLPFDITRSRTNNLPVYITYKNQKQDVITSIRKVCGDLKQLEHVVRQRIGNEQHYQINELTSQLHIRGKHKDQIVRLLKELGF